MYLCTGNIDSSIFLDSTGVDTTLWHHRLGHMSEKRMQILHKINLLSYLKQIDLDFYEHCVYGKKKESDFSESKKKRRLKGSSLCIKMYGDQLMYHLLVALITFIDDATKKTWVYSIRQKI